MWFDSSSVTELAESIESAELLKENIEVIKEYRSPSIKTNVKDSNNNKRNLENRNKRSAGSSSDEKVGVKPKSPTRISGRSRTVYGTDKEDKRTVKTPRRK